MGVVVLDKKRFQCINKPGLTQQRMDRQIIIDTLDTYTGFAEEGEYK